MAMSMSDRKKLLIKLKYIGRLGMNPSYANKNYPFDKRNDYTRDDIPYPLYCFLMDKYAHDFIPIDAICNEVKTVIKDVETTKNVVDVSKAKVEEKISEDLEKPKKKVVKKANKKGTK